MEQVDGKVGPRFITGGEMRKTFFSFMLLLLFVAGGHGAKGQKITIEQCQQWAVENYPMIAQHGLIDKAKEYSVQNLNKEYLPQFSLSGTAGWSDGIELPKNTDVTFDLGALNGGRSASTKYTVPIELDLPDAGEDFYNASVGLQQVIWAGGRIKAGKQIAEAETDMLHKGVNAQLYAIRGKVKDLFFGILILDGRIKQLEKADEVFAKVRERVEVALKEGVAFPADVDAVDVERLKYRQQREDLEVRLEGFLQMLSRFIHRPVSSVDELQMPETKAERDWENITRPELGYLDYKHKRYAADLKMINAENMPKLGLFVGGGFSRGGFDMDDEDKFEPSVMGAIRFSWNFGKLYTTRNEKRMVKLKQDGVELEKESFLFNTRTELVQYSKDVERLRKQLEADAEIVRLRENIMKSSQVKYDNGVYTISELIADVNAANIARQEQAIREIELKMALYTCDFVAGEKTE